MLRESGLAGVESPVQCLTAKPPRNTCMWFVDVGHALVNTNIYCGRHLQYIHYNMMPSIYDSFQVFHADSCQVLVHNSFADLLALMKFWIQGYDTIWVPAVDGGCLTCAGVVVCCWLLLPVVREAGTRTTLPEQVNIVEPGVWSSVARLRTLVCRRERTWSGNGCLLHSLPAHERVNIVVVVLLKGLI